MAFHGLPKSKSYPPCLLNDPNLWFPLYLSRQTTSKASGDLFQRQECSLMWLASPASAICWDLVAERETKEVDQGDWSISLRSATPSASTLSPCHWTREKNVHGAFWASWLPHIATVHKCINIDTNMCICICIYIYITYTQLYRCKYIYTHQN